MHWGTIGLGAVTAAVIALTVVVVVVLSPAPFAGAFDNAAQSPQPAGVAAVRATETPTPAATPLERGETGPAHDPSADLEAATESGPQPLVVSGFAIVTLGVGVLLALAYVRNRSGYGARREGPRLPPNS